MIVSSKLDCGPGRVCIEDVVVSILVSSSLVFRIMGSAYVYCLGIYEGTCIADQRVTDYMFCAR